MKRYFLGRSVNALQVTSAIRAESWQKPLNGPAGCLLVTSNWQGHNDTTCCVHAWWEQGQDRVGLLPPLLPTARPRLALRLRGASPGASGTLMRGRGAGTLGTLAPPPPAPTLPTVAANRWSEGHTHACHDHRHQTYSGASRGRHRCSAQSSPPHDSGPCARWRQPLWPNAF